LLILATSGGTTGSTMATVGYILFIIVLFYLLLIRPQRKQKKEKTAMLDSLSVGDEIYTIGGILGTVTRIKDKTIWLRISEKCEIELLKESISGINYNKAEE